MAKQYAERDPMALDQAGGYFTRRMQAMTRGGLFSKSAIAEELAHRDQLIDHWKMRALGRVGEVVTIEDA